MLFIDMRKFIMALIALSIALNANCNPVTPSNSRLTTDERGLFIIPGSPMPYSGKTASYFANGLKSEEITYENGILRKIFNWDKNGNKRMVKLYEADGSLKNHIIWYANGHKAYEEYYQNNIGVIVSWNDRGRKISETHYANNQLHGLSTVWYENGQKSHEETWINGNLAGAVSKWKRDGSKTR